MGTTRRADPYGRFSFRVTIGSDSGGPSHGGFTEVSGLGMETDIVEYREGNANDSAVRKLPAIDKVTDITLKRGVIAGDDLFQWLEAARNGGNDAARTVRIDLMAEDGTNRFAYWTLVNARPVKFTGLSLTSNAIYIAIEELVLAIEGVELA